MKRAFFFHYNKPASRSRGRIVWSLHHMGKCHLVDNIVCNVLTNTRTRKRQPVCVVAGKASSVSITKGVAYIC